MEVTDKRHYVVTQYKDARTIEVAFVLSVDEGSKPGLIEELFAEVIGTKFPYVPKEIANNEITPSEVLYRRINKIVYKRKKYNHYVMNVHVEGIKGVLTFAMTWYKSYQ